MMAAPPRLKLRHIVPSMVTVLAIGAGMTAIRMTLEGHLKAALLFVLLAVFFDGADGKLARFLDTASPFGAELDTLADFFNFGIVPGVLLYNTLYIDTEHSNLGWLATLILAVCCALRLARFNLSLKATDVSMTKDNHFVGVPAPALACLALMPIFMHLYGWQKPDLPFLSAAYIIGVGLLAICTFPTLSIKHASIKRAHLPFAIILAVVLAISLMAYPWLTLIVGNSLYLASLPICYMYHLKQPKSGQEKYAHSVD